MRCEEEGEEGRAESLMVGSKLDVEVAVVGTKVGEGGEQEDEEDEDREEAVDKCRWW
jgi:hypothetical protein